VELKRAWGDGTPHLLFEPLEFLEKLAALTPRPGELLPNEEVKLRYLGVA
jgi:hypothetical protein